MEEATGFFALPTHQLLISGKVTGGSDPVMEEKSLKKCLNADSCQLARRAENMPETSVGQEVWHEADTFHMVSDPDGLE